MFKKSVLAMLSGVALMAASAAALAADMPVKARSTAAYDWSGLYIGGLAGYGWMKSTDQILPVSDASNLIGGGFIATTLPLDPKGVVGGGLIGYNWQTPGSKWVLGIEADFSATGIKNTTSVTGPNDVSRVMTAEEKLNWMGTVRGRLGWTPADRLLVFATGGLAYGRRSLSTALTRTGSTCLASHCEQGSVTDTGFGWTVGGGVDWALTHNWILRGEYLYFDLGSVSHRMTHSLFPLSIFEANASFKGSIARAALSYKF